MRIIRFKIISSTNEIAKWLIQAGFAWEWDIIIAQEQHSGHGRNGRKWFSPPGGIYLSIIVKNIPKSAILSPAIGIAIAKAMGNEIKLKWPNDLIYKGKKVGGVLVEEFQDWFIIGIGINTFSENLLDTREFPSAITFPIKEDKKEELIKSIVENIKIIVGMIKRAKLEPIVKEWNRRAFRLGSNIAISYNDEVIVGMLEGITKDGYLIIRKNDTIIEISSGEIKEEIYYENG